MIVSPKSSNEMWLLTTQQIGRTRTSGTIGHTITNVETDGCALSFCLQLGLCQVLFMCSQAMSRILKELLEVSTEMVPHFKKMVFGDDREVEWPACLHLCSVIAQAVQAAKDVRKLLEEIDEFGKFNQKEFLWLFVPFTIILS